MNAINVPQGYQTLMPYLIVPDAGKFSEFMQSVFGAKERYKAMRNEKEIQHAELDINGSVIMFADATEQFAPSPAGMFIYTANCDDAYNKALEQGATSINAPADQPYGRSAGVRDAFGNTWWITSVR